MSPPAYGFVRVIFGLVAAALLATGAILAYIAVIAARRAEGVFLPAGYVAAACLIAGGLLLRIALRGP